MRRRLATALASCLLCAAWLGCNAILGNESAVFTPEDGGSRTNDGATGSDAWPPGTNPDGSIPDGANADTGPCVDTKTNAQHCGACFHDCRGGSCVEGVCQPVTLVTETGTPGPLALDATHVYWANRATGILARVPIAGGSPELVYAGSPASSPGEEFAVHQGYVYFSNTSIAGAVVRCPVTGCPITGPETVIPNLASPTFVSIDDAGVLLFVEGTNPGRVGRCTLPCTTIEEVATSESFPQRVAATADVVAWTTLIPSAVKVKTGVASPIAITASAAYGIAIVGGQIVFAQLDKGPRVMGIDGGALRPLVATETAQTDYLAVSGSDVFFADTRSSGRVMTCPAGGCDASTVLATGQHQPRSIAVDAKNVYWTNEGGNGTTTGEVMRVAR